MCKPLMLDKQTQCVFVKILLRQKYLFQVLFLHEIPYRYLNLIVLFLWTIRDQFLFDFLSWSQLVAYGSGSSYPNNKNPTNTNLTTSHGSS
jgi:hypothetical protein